MIIRLNYYCLMVILKSILLLAMTHLKTDICKLFFYKSYIFNKIV